MVAAGNRMIPEGKRMFGIAGLQTQFFSLPLDDGFARLKSMVDHNYSSHNNARILTV